MVVDFGGATLGAAIGLLFDAVKEITENNVMFKPTLESLTGTIEILKPLMEEVKQLNEELTQRQQESTYYESQIKEGEKHVRKCSKVCRYNIFKKFYYTNKLLELDRTLKTLIVIGFSARDSKETLIKARQILDFMKASYRSSASVSNETLILVRKILAKIEGEQGMNIVEPADQVPSMLSSHISTKQEPDVVQQPPPLIKPPPPFTKKYDTESHDYDKYPVAETFGMALGPESGSSLDAVKKLVGKSIVTMKPVIDKVKATLQVLVTLISQIEKFHTELDLPNGQTITDIKFEIEKAAELIKKCSNVSRFNLLKKKRYKDMLLRLDETLSRLVQILQIQLARDVKKSLVLVREVHANIVEHAGINDVGLNQILSRVSSINVSSSPTVPPPHPQRIYEGRAF